MKKTIILTGATIVALSSLMLASEYASAATPATAQFRIIASDSTQGDDSSMPMTGTDNDSGASNDNGTNNDATKNGDNKDDTMPDSSSS